MDKIIDQYHNRETFLYSLSRLFERAGYYGLRGLVVLYMISEILKLETSEALSIYGWLTTAVVFSQIIGAVIGDLVVGNKKTIIIGGIIQSIGAFGLCIPSINGLYFGLFLIAFGSGLISPNIISNFGKLYLGKTKLLDAGFSILYMAVNLGSFIGALFIGYSGEEYGFNVGFILSGIFILISIFPLLFVANEKSNYTNVNFSKLGSKSIGLRKKSMFVLFTLLIVGLFWEIYGISTIRLFGLQMEFNDIISNNIPKSFWQIGSTIFLFPVSFIAIFIWTYFYNSQLMKLLIGCVCGIISFVLLFLIPEIPSAQHVLILFLALLFLAISEAHVAPIIHSVLTKYGNPKYLAILISLAFLPTRMLTLLFGLFNYKFQESPMEGLLFGIIVLTIVSVGLLWWIKWDKQAFLNGNW